MNNKTLVTRESVAAAAAAIRDDGKNPTMASVRDALGGGSFASISPLLAEWKNSQAKAAVALKLPVPQALHLALQEVAEQAWGMAQDSAASRLQNEREALHIAAQELQGREAEMLDELSANEDALAKASVELAALRDAASTASAEAVATKAGLDVKIGELSVENARISESLRLTREQLEKAGEDLVKTNARLETERSASTRLEALRADLAYELDVEKGKLRLAEEELTETRVQVADLQSELSKTQQEMVSTKQQLASEQARATEHAHGMQKLIEQQLVSEQARAETQAQGLQKLIEQMQEQLQGERVRCDSLQSQLVELAKQTKVEGEPKA